MTLNISFSTSEPAELAEMIRPFGGDVVVMERGKFRSDVTRLNLDRLWLQHAEEELPRVWHGPGSATRVALTFQTRPGSAIAFRGEEAHASDIAIIPAGQLHILQRLTGPSSWGSMSLSSDDWDDVCTTAGCDRTAPSIGTIFRPTASDMARLQRLHHSTAHLARDAPALFGNPEVVRGIEQSLIQVMIDCLQQHSSGKTTVSVRRRAIIMKRFHDLLDECREETVYVPELCARLGISARSLLTVCHEYLGMGPKKYLHLRRMNLARRALLHGDVTKTSTTEIAMQFGFWQLGRFAVDYKALFGESPSTTLQR